MVYIIIFGTLLLISGFISLSVRIAGKRSDKYYKILSNRESFTMSFEGLKFIISSLPTDDKAIGDVWNVVGGIRDKGCPGIVAGDGYELWEDEIIIGTKHIYLSPKDYYKYLGFFYKTLKLLSK